MVQRPSRRFVVSFPILLLLGTALAGCGALHEDQSLFCKDPCPSGYERTLSCNCVKKADDDPDTGKSGGRDGTNTFRGVFLVTGDPCTPEGEENKIFNNTSRTKRVRVQTTRWDDAGQADYTYDWYDVGPKEERFVGCKVHLRRVYRIVRVVEPASGPGPGPDKPRVVDLGSLRRTLESPLGTWALARWTGDTAFVLTADDSRPDCRRECQGDGYLCSLVPERRLQGWKKGLDHFYTRSVTAAEHGGILEAATLVEMFGAAEDPCERGDLVFEGGRVYNAGRDCTLTGDITLGGRSVAFEVDLPGLVEGRVLLGDAPRAVFSDPAAAPEIRFPRDAVWQSRFGGTVTSITLSAGDVLIGSADRCISLSTGGRSPTPGSSWAHGHVEPAGERSAR